MSLCNFTGALFYKFLHIYKPEFLMQTFFTSSQGVVQVLKLFHRHNNKSLCSLELSTTADKINFNESGHDICPRLGVYTES